MAKQILAGVFVFAVLMGPGCVSDPFAQALRNRLSTPMADVGPGPATQTASGPITAENADAVCQTLLDEVERELKELPP